MTSQARLKVLVSVRPYRGHLHPFIPLAKQLQAAGHKVAVATARDVADIVTVNALTWFAAGLHPREAARRFPLEDPAYGRSTLATKVDDLLDLMRHGYRPGIVIRDPTDLAAAVASELIGVPCVTLGVGNFIPVASWQYLARDSLAALRAALGLTPEPDLDFLYRPLYADLVPPSFQWCNAPPTSGVASFGYRAWDGGEGRAAPSWLAELPSRPTVLVTLGTVYNHHPTLLRRFLRSLVDEDLNLICTVGDEETRVALGAVAANIHLERYLPHSLILPYCDAMLCHAGFNTAMGALCAGVPIVGVPLGADQFYNANRCDELGAGIALTEADATPDAIRDAVHRVVAEPPFRERAMTIRTEIDELPDLGDLVGRLEHLSHQPSVDAWRR